MGFFLFGAEYLCQEVIYCPGMTQRKSKPSLTEMAWIVEHRPVLWHTAQGGWKQFGRGFISVDTGLQSVRYCPQKQIARFGGRDEVTTVAGYDPSWECVIMLLKPKGWVSWYRVGVPGRKR